MKKYEAIIKCINDKLKENDNLLEYYREETSKKDARIRELEKKNGDLELAYCDATSQNNELTSELENLREEYAKLLKANESLKAENNKLTNF